MKRASGPEMFKPVDLNSVKKEFEELLMKIFRIQSQCKMLKAMVIRPFDPGYEYSTSHNQKLSLESEKLIQEQQKLLPRVRELSNQLSTEEHNTISIKAQQKVDQEQEEIKMDVTLKVLSPI
jgi:hypothetical protein